MATPIPFRRDFTVDYGVLEPVAPGIRRIVARNPGPFTFRGTGTYVVGRGKVAVIDPGPDLADHAEALIAALAGETVTHIVVTHTHRDHSPAAAVLASRTGAPTYGFGPHGGGRGRPAEHGTGEEGADWDFTPAVTVRDRDVIEGDGWRLEAVHTPGHTSNHLCLALPEEGVLFTGDHVMGWSTSVIVPPDGDMAAYMASLGRLLRREDRVYWPTHGPAIPAPRPYVAAFIAHRRERADAILHRIARGDHAIRDMVRAIYADVDPVLHGAAARSVLAHLIELHRAGRVASDGPPTLAARYRLPP